MLKKLAKKSTKKRVASSRSSVSTVAARKKATRPRTDKPTLRLEWVEAGSLTRNPRNWRLHPPEQTKALGALLSDPEIGWAGALLYNERTKQLIDGHARLDLVDAETPVPVLIGKWSPAAELKILASLDPLARMAYADPEQLQVVMAEIDLSDEVFAGLMQELQAELNAALPPADDDMPDGLSAGHSESHRAGYEQITFMLTERQAATVRKAITAAIDAAPFGNTGNVNKNGNAIVRIAKHYVR